jgi:hypothetical protein
LADLSPCRSYQVNLEQTCRVSWALTLYTVCMYVCVYVCMYVSLQTHPCMADDSGTFTTTGGILFYNG